MLVLFGQQQLILNFFLRVLWWKLEKGEIAEKFSSLSILLAAAALLLLQCSSCPTPAQLRTTAQLTTHCC